MQDLVNSLPGLKTESCCAGKYKRAVNDKFPDKAAQSFEEVFWFNKASIQSLF